MINFVSKYFLDNDARWWAEVESHYTYQEYSAVCYAEFLAQLVASGPFSALIPRSTKDFGAFTEGSFLAHSGRSLVDPTNLGKRVAAMVELFSNPSNNRSYLIKMSQRLSDKCLEANEVGLAAILYEAKKNTDKLLGSEESILSLKKKEELKARVREILDKP